MDTIFTYISEKLHVGMLRSSLIWLGTDSIAYWTDSRDGLDTVGTKDHVDTFCSVSSMKFILYRPTRTCVLFMMNKI